VFNAIHRTFTKKMQNVEFRKNAHQLVDWMADYLENLEDLPVKPNIKPGDVHKQLPSEAPQEGEDFQDIFKDFKDIILPGMTHWQHPQFFAYFPTGGSEPSILAEMLATTMGAQCMIWLTSPAAEELETRMMEWIRAALALPQYWTGVIQDSSSSSTLVSLLTARESKSSFDINKNGYSGKEKYRAYCSTQAHSSVDKDVKIAGLGLENLIKIEVDGNYSMLPNLLELAIVEDIKNGFTPLCVVSTLGSTSSCGIDPLDKIGEICQKYGLWHHCDASYAGTVLLLPEMRWMSKGLETLDSFVFNPHKWMFTHFDCSAYFVKDKNALTQTFSILPEYLKTPEDLLVNNYRDWGVPLGRRFRALKLWFVIRSYGIEQMQTKIREHIEYGQWLGNEVENHPDFELMAPVTLNLVCFRYHPKTINDEEILENLNKNLLQKLNDSGKILLTQTRLQGKYVIRFVAGQTHLKKEDVIKGWRFILENV
jgi:aromatic-L-amino-acid/L-tryptophan decarboxylase